MVLIGQILIVFGIVLAGIWYARSAPPRPPVVRSNLVFAPDSSRSTHNVAHIMCMPDLGMAKPAITPNHHRLNSGGSPNLHVKFAFARGRLRISDMDFHSPFIPFYLRWTSQRYSMDDCEVDHIWNMRSGHAGVPRRRTK